MSDNLYLFANNNGTQAENFGSYRLYDMKIEGDSEVTEGVKYADYLIYSAGGVKFKTNVTFKTDTTVEYSLREDLMVYDGDGFKGLTAIFQLVRSDGVCIENDTLIQGGNCALESGVRTSLKPNAEGVYSYTFTKNINSTRSLMLGCSVTGWTGVRAIEYMKFYQLGKLVAYLRPAFDTEGNPCVYDDVSKTYLYNQGTGTFKCKKTLRDFQPVLDSNNIPCLLDKANKKYYYNKGTGVFNTKEKVPYKRLKYISTDGNQLIDCGSINFTQNTKFEIDFTNEVIGNNTHRETLFSTNRGYVFLVERTGGFSWKASTNSSGLREVSDGNHLTTRKTFTYCKDGIFQNNVKIVDVDTSVDFKNDFNHTDNLILFKAWVGNTNAYYNAEIKLHEFKLYQSDQLVLDLIPVLDQNNIPCMYDKVTETFFYNQGTGTFGYEVEELVAPQVDYVKYLESSNEQYINTNIIQDGNIKGIIEMQDLYDNKGEPQSYFGTKTWRLGNNGFGIKQGIYGNTYATDSYTMEELSDGYTRYEFNQTHNSGFNIYLFADCGGNNDVRRFSKIKVKSFKLINKNTEEVLFNGKPCLDPNGTPCMYDAISKQYFYNQGTGQFNYGERIGYTEIEYIESTGTQYIDTGVVPNSNTDIDMTCRLSANPYLCIKNKCDISTVALSEDTIIEMDFKYGGTRLGDSRALENYLYILADGTYSLDGSTSTGVLASTNYYDHLKFILSITEGKEYLYVNGVKIGEKSISSLSRLKFGGTYNNCATFYMHYANVYKKSDLTPIALITPVMDDYEFSNSEYTYTYHIPKLYNSITGNYYKTVYGDAIDNQWMEYGYDKNYIYNNLKLLNISKTQYSESEQANRRKKIYDRTVYEYKGTNTTVQPNLVVSEGATLTMGSTNLAMLSDEEIERAVNDGWSLL